MEILQKIKDAYREGQDKRSLERLGTSALIVGSMSPEVGSQNYIKAVVGSHEEIMGRARSINVPQTKIEKLAFDIGYSLAS